MQTSWKLTLKNITWKPQELVELGEKKHYIMDKEETVIEIRN